MLVFQMKRQGEIFEGMLVPELCHMTGIEDSMRKDFRMMKELGNHTKLAP